MKSTSKLRMSLAAFNTLRTIVQSNQVMHLRFNHPARNCGHTLSSFIRPPMLLDRPLVGPRNVIHIVTTMTWVIKIILEPIQFTILWATETHEEKTITVFLS